MATREERLSRLATQRGFGYEEQGGIAWLLNEEGERIHRLVPGFIDAVADVGDDDAQAILAQLYVVHLSANEKAYARGQRAGRDALISTVHELLGIDRVVDTLQQAACMRAAHG